MTMPSLEQSMPSKWVLWASQQARSPQLAEVARRALCFHPFSEAGLLEDVVTVWKIHDGAGCDADTTAGEVRSQIQKTFLSGLSVRELPPVDEAICIRAMTIAVNFATDGNTYKATGDRLIHDFIRCHLRVEDLAAIPSNQPPYAANARLDKAETIIKEVVHFYFPLRHRARPGGWGLTWHGGRLRNRHSRKRCPALNPSSRATPRSCSCCGPSLQNCGRKGATPAVRSFIRDAAGIRAFPMQSHARQNVQRRGVIVRGPAPCQ